jgi:branched-chain amino acid transport system ATP-binding protein
VKSDSGEVLFKNKKITGLPPHRIADLGVTRTFQIMSLITVSLLSKT